MRTAVQLRTGAADPEKPRTELLAGLSAALTRSALGPVALFEPGEVVAYLLRCRRRAAVFVFRTLEVDDPLAANVPGVCPRVRLLLEVRTPGRIRRARGLFAYLLRTGRDPSALPDDFYVRIGAVLGGRLPARKILLPLLRSVRPLRAGDSASRPAGQGGDR